MVVKVRPTEIDGRIDSNGGGGIVFLCAPKTIRLANLPFSRRKNALKEHQSGRKEGLLQTKTQGLPITAKQDGS